MGGRVPARSNPLSALVTEDRDEDTLRRESVHVADGKLPCGVPNPGAEPRLDKKQVGAWATGGNQRLAVVAIGVLFIAGLVLLQRVDDPKAVPRQAVAA
jgi:hypothetical protein